MTRNAAAGATCQAQSRDRVTDTCACAHPAAHRSARERGHAGPPPPPRVRGVSPEPALAGTLGPLRPYRAVLERTPQARQVGLGAPDLGDEALVGDVEAAQVQHVVNGLHLLHLDGARVDRLGGLAQHLPQIVLGLVQHLARTDRLAVARALSVSDWGTPGFPRGTSPR